MLLAPRRNVKNLGWDKLVWWVYFVPSDWNWNKVLPYPAKIGGDHSTCPYTLRRPLQDLTQIGTIRQIFGGISLNRHQKLALVFCLSINKKHLKKENYVQNYGIKTYYIWGQLCFRVTPINIFQISFRSAGKFTIRGYY